MTARDDRRAVEPAGREIGEKRDAREGAVQTCLRCRKGLGADPCPLSRNGGCDPPFGHLVLDTAPDRAQLRDEIAEVMAREPIRGGGFELLLCGVHQVGDLPAASVEREVDGSAVGV